MVVIALGITWVLDGLEVTLAGAIGSALRDPRALGLTDSQVGLSGSAYLAGAVIGALLFGYATDRFGRRKLFFLTLALYVGATAATACSWNATSYCIFRAFYRRRHRRRICPRSIQPSTNSSRRASAAISIWSSTARFWIGAALGSGITITLLDLSHLPPNLAWRFAFGVGALLGLIILFLRNIVPESPRWLLTRGHPEEAEKIVAEVEQKAEQSRMGEEPGPARLN